MNKQTKSLTEPKKANNLALCALTERLNLRGTLTQAEAVEWVRRYRNQAMEIGKKEAFYWWQATLEDITKRRGQQSADNLRKRMNSLKEKND